jgi:hypothetical protein
MLGRLSQKRIIYKIEQNFVYILMVIDERRSVDDVIVERIAANRK